MATVTALDEPGRSAPPPPSPSPSPAPHRRARRFDLGAAFTAAAALGGWRLGLRPLSDNSFFVHLVTGRMLQSHGVPHADVYSFTAAGRPWTAESWLVEWTYGRLDAGVGGYGIRIFIAVIGALLFAGMYRLGLHASRDRKRAALVMLATFGPVVALFDERPLSVGLLALLAVVWCAELPDTWLGRHGAVALPVIFWFWSSSHGSWALGYAYLGLHVLGRWIDGAPWWRPGRERSIVIGSAAGLAVMCVNPYGPAFLWFPVALLSKSDVLRNVVEWKSPDFHSTGPMLFAGFLVVTFVAFARGNRPSRRDLLVCIPFVLLALWALRNIGIATIVALPILGRAVAGRAVVGHDGPVPSPALAAGGSEHSHAAQRRDAQIAKLIVALLVALGLVLTISATATADFDTRAFSQRALTAVEQNGLLGRRLLTTDANAAYVLLKDWPRQHVFMDDRYDMFPRQVVVDYLALSHGAPGWSRILDRYRIRVVIWPSQGPLASLLATDRQWHLVHRDRAWVVYAR